MAADEDTAMHSAGVMVELHFKESRPDTGRLPRASLCSRAKRSRPKGGPGKQHCGAAADPTQHTRDLFGIGLDERTGGPQQQEKDHDPEQKFRHGYFSCSINLATPALCALRSARAL